MSDEGWSCCYVLVADRAAAEVAALLGGRHSGPVWSEREATELSAPWPAVGPASDGWSVVIDPHFEFGDSDAELRQSSVGTRIVCLRVIERERFSHATLWADGEIVWDVSFEAELDERPLVDDRFPYDVDALASAIGSPGSPETWYQVLVMAVQLLTGWQPHPAGDSDQRLFAELVYPRPHGVAASVARDLSGEPPDPGSWSPRQIP